MNRLTARPFPSGACDTHIHFYDGRFTASAAATLHPSDAAVADYRQIQHQLGLTRVVVVQPTTYGLDNSCQLAAMAEFGDNARGVMVVDSSTTEAELDRLTGLGVRGARFHMLPGGAVPWSELAKVAERVHEHDWHIQLQLNGRELPDRFEMLSDLPCPLVIDHVGRFMPPVDVGHRSFAALQSLVDSGNCWVKLSAPYESSLIGSPGYGDVSPLVEALVEQAPDKMLWASNWPHPGRVDPPPAEVLAALATEWLGDGATRQRVLVDNPCEVYGF